MKKRFRKLSRRQHYAAPERDRLQGRKVRGQRYPTGRIFNEMLPFGIDWSTLHGPYGVDLGNGRCVIPRGQTHRQRANGHKNPYDSAGAPISPQM